MSSPLFPCPSCCRHVRVGSGACPFCASALPQDPAVVPAAPSGSLTRAAIFVFATTVAACSSSQPQPAQSVVAQDPVVAASDGDASTASSGGPASPAGGDSVGPGAVAALYGVPAPPVEPPAVDASVAADGSADVVVADASPVDAAVDASRRDAGRPRPPPVRPPRIDPGAIMVRYGSPPADFA